MQVATTSNGIGERNCYCCCNGNGIGERNNSHAVNSIHGNGIGERNNDYGYPRNSGNGSGDNGDGDNNNQPPPLPELDLYTQVHNIVTSNLEPGRQLAALVELGAATGHPLNGIQKIATEIELSLNRQNTAPDDATELSKLLTYRAEHLDIPSIYPKALASALLSKADSARIDPIYLITYLLSACGAKLGGNIGIVAKSGATTEDDWVEFPIFWTMNVAPPSSGKSQTQRTIFKPIKRQLKLARTQYKQAKQHLFAIWSKTVVGLDSMLTGVYEHLKNLPNALKDIRRSISRSNEATIRQSWEASKWHKFILFF